jgi:hypothetical protein
MNSENIMISEIRQRHKKISIALLHLYEVSRRVQLRHREKGIMVARRGRKKKRATVQ